MNDRHTKSFLGILVVAALLSGCGPAATAAPTGIAPSSEGPGTQALATGNMASGPSATPSEPPFVVELTPEPSETPLPTLALPAPPAFLTDLQFWDGAPTYPAESRADFYFRLRFDPTAWALTTDQFGAPALAWRTSPDCVISPTAGRGLPLNATVDHQVRQLGSVTFQVDTTLVAGMPASVNYTGGDGAILTAFLVSFQSNADSCISAAESILTTLRSVPVLEATPITGP
jgi:hypothetical protein